MKKSCCLTGLILIGLTASMSVQAQSLYRCGSTYQDQPCEGTQKGKKLVGGGSASPNGSVSDAACAQRGMDAQKIVWAREGGALQDQQLAKATNASQQKLTIDVYARRGTSSDIRAAIEADCIAAKDRAAQAAALLEASRGGESQSAPTAPAPEAFRSKPTDESIRAENAAKESAVREAANKKIRCDHIKKQLETVASSQRAGGNAGYMESLNQQKRDIERRSGLEKCE